MITWIDADSDDDASISLYYDSDASGYDGILLAYRISEDEHGNSGSYIWNVSMIPEGDYFIYAVIDDGITTSRDYSQGRITITRTGTINTAPKILLLSPEKGIQHVNFNFTILWIDSDSDDDASISLYYDTDQNGYDGTLISSDLSENDITDSFLWNTKDIPEGEYYIYAMIDDGVNSVVYDYSDGKVAINHTGFEVEEEQENVLQDNLLFIILGVAFVLILLGIFLKRRGKGDEEDEGDEDFEDEEEDFDEPENKDEEDVELPEDELEKKEEHSDDEIDDELLPPPKDF
jgi:hypothetical protein